MINEWWLWEEEIQPGQVWKERLTVAWDTAHENTVYGYGGLEDHFDAQVEIDIPKPSSEFVQFSSSVKSGTSETKTFAVPPGIDVLYIRVEPGYFESGGKQLWIKADLFNPSKCKLGYHEILVTSECAAHKCTTTMLVRKPVPGTWTIKLTGKTSRFKQKRYTGKPVPFSVIIGEGSIPITNLRLKEVTLLVVSNPGTIYFPEEIEAIREFVFQGGSLLVIEIPSMRGYTPSTRCLTQLFGVDVVGDELHGQFRTFEPRNIGQKWPLEGIIECKPMTQHYITKGLQKVVAFRPGAFRIIDKQPFVYQDMNGKRHIIESSFLAQGVLMAGHNVRIPEVPTLSPIILLCAVEFGKGRVVVSGSPDFVNYATGRLHILSTVLDYDCYDNKVLSERILDWLLKREH